ncbi:MAG: PAS domain-containing protein [Arcicella sp.]|nr:PAS domain-containing protein [Arcicella sp.]
MDLSEYLLDVFSSEKQSDLFDSFLRAIPDFVYLLDLSNRKIKYLNEKTGIIAHYTEDEVLSLDKSFFPVRNYENREEFIDKMNSLFSGLEIGDHRSFTLDLVTKEGERRIVRNRGTLLKKNKDDIPTKVVVIAEDITIETESNEREKQKQLQLDNAESLFNYGSWEWTLGTEYVTWSNGLFNIFGYDATEYLDSKMAYGEYNRHIVEEDKERTKILSYEAIANKREHYEFEHSIIDEKGARKLIAVKGKPCLDKYGNVIRVFGTSEDITELSKLKNTLEYKVQELSKVYEELKKSKDLFKEAESLMSYGSFDWEVKNDVLMFSDGLRRLFGGSKIAKVSQKLTYEFFISRLHKDDVVRVKEIIEKAIRSKKTYSFEYRLTDLDGKEKTVHTQGWVTKSNENGSIRLTGNTVDITEIKIYEKELRHKIEELNRSNQDLEQFAYIASHDLQEPLRKIMAFGERLSSKYSEHLSTDGQFYISRMMDAANRMKILMENLLSYSRVSIKAEPVELVDLGVIIESVLSDLEMKIQDVDAQITLKSMPTINALPTQMHQLFQNLISNSLKFVKQNEKPIIRIEASLVSKEEMELTTFNFGNNKYHKIVVSDNGIGFDAEYSEKIFLIFQRLHGRSEFEGTGLGLAITKKIIDNHQGFIVAESEVNKGSKFTVYLPNNE